jgi:hypothetical protein
LSNFLWVQGPPYGVCFGCGTSASDRGFVQTWTDVDVKQNGTIVGVADVFFCANCIYAQGRMVGMSTPQETEEFARREIDLNEQLDKLKDEIQAWQQKFLQDSDLSVEDLDQLKARKTLDDASSDS